MSVTVQSQMSLSTCYQISFSNSQANFSLQEEWRKKISEWEEERGSLVARTQEAEQASREAAEEAALVRNQV